jgi:predicted nucleic acid-binding protein
VIHLDTSVLIDALTVPGRSEESLMHTIDQGLEMRISAVVLYEWLRGPRSAGEVGIQEALFPETSLVPFGKPEARLAGQIYRVVKRPRGREADIAIAATALYHKARLWTLNTGDFADIPGLQLYKPR